MAMWCFAMVLYVSMGGAPTVLYWGEPFRVDNEEEWEKHSQWYNTKKGPKADGWDGYKDIEESETASMDAEEQTETVLAGRASKSKSKGGRKEAEESESGSMEVEEQTQTISVRTRSRSKSSKARTKSVASTGSSTDEEPPKKVGRSGRRNKKHQ